jgi:hypothetical protein
MAAVKSDQITFSIDGDERAAEAFSAKITRAKVSGDETFAEAAAGGGFDYFIEGDAIQDPSSADSIWSLVFDAAGDPAGVPVVFRPYGNAVASAGAPHFHGNVLITADEGDLAGGDANSGAERYKTPFKFRFLAKPTKVTT